MPSDVEVLQAQVASLLAERGIPADPIEAGLKNVKDHLSTVAAMHPSRDFSDLLNRHEELGNKPTAEQTAAFLNAVNAVGPDHDMAYVRQLAAELHQEVLDGAAKASVQAETTDTGDEN